MRRLAALHGIDVSYESGGRVLPVAAETVVAVLAAFGVDASDAAAGRRALEEYAARDRRRLLPAFTTAVAGRPCSVRVPEGAQVWLELEDGGEIRDLPRTPYADRRGLPEGLPLGVHRLRARLGAEHGRGDGGEVTAEGALAVTPRRLGPPPGPGWGLMAQLYSVLSRRSWGMGDLADLAELASWSARELGAGFVQINPLHAAIPVPPADPSPYRPSSRRFPDPVYLAVERVPEYAHLEAADRARVDELAARARALTGGVLREGALIDRDAVWTLKRAALEIVHRVARGVGREADYRAFLAREGAALEDHATWCALAERHGPAWRSWPAALRDPRSAAVRRARADAADRVDFHRWLVWLCEEQLAEAQRRAVAAGMPIGLVHDLAVGVHPEGADAWALQGVLAPGVTVGAPPDAFSPHGQDWSLPAWRPDALAEAGYGPYRELLRAVSRHAGAVRVDHVMGLFRLWWVPEGAPPTAGAYVRYDAEAMVGLLALEAHRAGTAVIGEDLGTVEPGVREVLADRGVLGTSVLWFERDYARGADGVSGRAPVLPPGRWRELCLATVTTHDLPPTAARLSGDAVRLRHRLGLLGGEAALEGELAADAVELEEWLGILVEAGLLPEGAGEAVGAGGGEAGAGGGGEELAERRVVEALHRFLLRTPARLVGVWLPDGVGDRRPQNVPGTFDEYPNWRLPVADPRGRPLSLEELVRSDRLRSLARVFATRSARR
ncbi:4-alpha-glucanotransferase [Allostreptomyces psammosilenae]|uniref:4-alpha-glucanotransferase n=1 Tax=Allostreptomyces psammosilenae TaxID=1892865 RepID=UPI001FECD6F0|nr:4-alpha-glucanotransferase [Allostreptomyces psammosilenae]